MLREAIVGEDWPRALALALDTWRAAPAPALADLIDAITARCPRLVENDAAWIAASTSYDPVTAGVLAHHAHANVTGCTAWDRFARRLADHPFFARLFPAPAWPADPPRVQRNRIERLCAFARWPPDPRVATVLARWFVQDAFLWNRPYERGSYALQEILAEELIRMRTDARPRGSAMNDAIAEADRPRARLVLIAAELPQLEIVFGR